MKQLLFLAALLGTIQLSAQNEAIFSQYTVQPFLLNPSLAGFDDVHQIRLNYRSSWTGFPEAPNTYALNYNGPVGKVFGIGGQITAENIADLFRYNIKLSYAFNHAVEDFEFAGGFSTAFVNFRLKSSGASGFGIDDTDPEIMEALDAENSFDASLGFFVRYKRQTFVGLTFPTLVSERLDQIENGVGERGSAENFILRVGQEVRIRERNFKVTPSIVVSRVFGAPFRVDFNAITSFLDEQFVAGIGYRAGAGNDVGLLLGTKLDQLRLFYSYDINFGEFQSYNSGGHEITLGFDFAGGKQEVDAARYD